MAFKFGLLFPGDDYEAWKSLASWGYRWSIYVAFGAATLGLISAFFLLFRFYAQNRVDDLKDSKAGEKLIAILDNPPTNYEGIYAQILPLTIPGSQYDKYKSLLDKASEFPVGPTQMEGVLNGGELFTIDTYTFLVRKFPIEFWQDTALIRIANEDPNTIKRNFYASLSKNSLLGVVSKFRQLVDEESWTRQHEKSIHFMLTAMCGDNGILLPEFKKKFTHEQLNRIRTSWTTEELEPLHDYIKGQLETNGLLTSPTNTKSQ